MGVQDDLAVIAAARALESADLVDLPDPERTGVFLAVGYIPFEGADIEELASQSFEEGSFSMERFSTAAFRSMNPLLTFRCLSNMPAFHVTLAFGIQGPYFVTYPGPGQFYLALEEALDALSCGQIDLALVGGTAHQRNALVEHHFRRLEPPVPCEALKDAAGFLVLETSGSAARRGAPGKGLLADLSVAFSSFDPFAGSREPIELFDGSAAAVEMGPASLPFAMDLRKGGPLTHRIRTRDGIEASSVWEGCP